MFDDFYGGPRTWKWAVPAAIFILLIPVTGKMYASSNGEVHFWAMVPCGFGFLFLAIAMVNLWKLVTRHMQELFDDQQRALSTTPLVLLSENMKTMHPEAVRVLNRFGVRTSWQVRVHTNIGMRDWVLADTNVHFGFIEFVLSRSTKAALYPKNRLSEGSKKWDPDGLAEDREQYDELEKWLFARMMVTRSFGPYKPAEFIPPWTPDLILETMGLTDEQDLYRPEEEVKAKDLNGKQSAVSDQRSAVSDQRSAVSDQPGNGQHEAKPLNEEELEAIQIENQRNASLYLQEEGV